MQVLMQARNLCLCNAGMLRTISRLWGTDGSGALPTENDACRELGIDVKKELNQRQCFSHLTDIIQQLISGFAEIPKSEVAISRNKIVVCGFVCFCLERRRWQRNKTEAKTAEKKTAEKTADKTAEKKPNKGAGKGKNADKDSDVAASSKEARNADKGADVAASPKKARKKSKPFKLE